MAGFSFWRISWHPDTEPRSRHLCWAFISSYCLCSACNAAKYCHRQRMATTTIKRMTKNSEWLHTETRKYSSYKWVAISMISINKISINKILHKRVENREPVGAWWEVVRLKILLVLAIHDTILLFPYGSVAGSTIDKSITKQHHTNPIIQVCMRAV
jgi:hypothetical protein